jgi:(1->4)-alpha-D-glucan 1-alpha-D-glucosylmutase
MPSEVPTATYRLQLSSAFGFDHAARLVPYLKSLGISHLYASPFLKARTGSAHGYDIVDHNQLNPEFGGEAAFARLSDALAHADIGLILDFVPNHMGIGFADNIWWLDVLEWGEKSPHAAAFDIDWDLLPYRREGGVMLPILGRPYGDALENDEIVLKYAPAEGSFSAWYYQHRLPISPYRYGEIIRTVVNAAGATLSPGGRQLIEIADLYRRPTEPSRAQAPAYKAAIAAATDGADIIEHGLAVYRPQPGDRATAITLHHLLERQHYRLAHWQVAIAEINYRRFFDVSSLAGIRIEDPQTFHAVHQLIARLIAERRLHGLRLDHIDGLRDPVQYCRRLQRIIREAQRTRGAARPFYVLVEKILAEGEPMPKLAGVAGTTGYEWLNVIARVLVDDHGLAPLDRLRREITGSDRSFDDIVQRAKRRVLASVLASEFTVLTRLLARIAAGYYRTRDYGISRLQAAFELFIVRFPVYRTYVTAAGASPEDRAIIDQALAAARAEWLDPDAGIFDFLRDALTLDLIGPDRVGYSRARVCRFAFKVQQFTGPMMAKSLEDTAFYRYHRLAALNEVGGDPAARGLSIAEFHERMRARSETAPRGMTTTATHDTKRGEDARARILALSELTEEWANAVGEWRQLNERFVARAGHLPAPASGHEYLLYQTLVGAWRLDAGVDQDFCGRIEAYVIKAAREGKVETSWTNPNQAYEVAFGGFVRRALDPHASGPFIQSFDAFVRRAALLGALNSLSQLTLKATVPGVPDFYQGTEFWDLSLVDPDNRRTVDFAERAAALEYSAVDPDWSLLVREWRNGVIKLVLTRRLLALRTQLTSVFQDGTYRPVEVRGECREHVIAFSRSAARETVIVAVGRHFGGLTDAGRRWPEPSQWDGALALEGHRWRDVLMPQRRLSMGHVPLATLFDPLPVAILHGSSPIRPERA